MRIAQPLIWQICFVDCSALGVLFVVNSNLAVVDLNLFTGQTDNSLDEVLFRVTRITHDNDVAPVGLMQMVRKFVDNQILTVLKIRFHGGSGNDKGLEYKIANWDDNYKC